MVESSVDFATVASKLLPNVITKLDLWKIARQTSGVSNCHIASCLAFVIKMWHTTMEMDEPPVITVK